MLCNNFAETESIHDSVGLSLALADLISDPRKPTRVFHTFRSYFIHVANNRDMKGTVWYEELDGGPEGRIKEAPKKQLPAAMRSNISTDPCSQGTYQI